MCVFCEKPLSLFDNEGAFVQRSLYPVSEGHLLVIPRNHFTDPCEFLNLHAANFAAAVYMARAIINLEVSTDLIPAYDGLTMGFNHGAAAGQTIEHVHFHVIPRRFGDVENPRGGIRNVIPWLGDYTQGQYSDPKMVPKKR